jgi:hypothetical protein
LGASIPDESEEIVRIAPEKQRFESQNFNFELWKPASEGSELPIDFYDGLERCGSGFPKKLKGLYRNRKDKQLDISTNGRTVFRFPDAFHNFFHRKRPKSAFHCGQPQATGLHLMRNKRRTQNGAFRAPSARV